MARKRQKAGYAEAYRNSIVLETDDPLEIVTELTALQERPRVAAEIRKRGRITARDAAIIYLTRI